MYDRDQALAVFEKYNKSEALLRHALSVEGVMRKFADDAGEDANYWGIVGLLHDLDYEMYPDEHCKKTPELLKDNGYDDAFIHAVVSHGYGLVVDVKPELYMEKVLYTIDELTGLIAAAALMRPSKSVLDMELKSLKKKFKDKAFAAKVDRNVIKGGCEMLGMELDDVMKMTMAGMCDCAQAIGLQGSL